MSKICEKELRSLSVFNNVSEETFKLLEKNGRRKKIKKGEQIFLDKEFVEYIYIILNGKVTLYKISEMAQKKVIFILDRGKIINEVILEELPTSINCEVFDSGELLVYPKKVFLEIMEKDFQLTKNVINSLSQKVRRLYRQMKNTTTLKIEKRLAAKLWKLSKDYKIERDDGIEIGLKITITYLADMFGCPRETISRAVKKLEQNGLIKQDNKKLIIIDRDELSKYFKEF